MAVITINDAVSAKLCGVVKYGQKFPKPRDRQGSSHYHSRCENPQVENCVYSFFTIVRLLCRLSSTRQPFGSRVLT